jgi:hypothetical protein
MSGGGAAADGYPEAVEDRVGTWLQRGDLEAMVGSSIPLSDALGDTIMAMLSQRAPEWLVSTATTLVDKSREQELTIARQAEAGEKQGKALDEVLARVRELERGSASLGGEVEALDSRVGTKFATMASSQTQALTEHSQRTQDVRAPFAYFLRRQPLRAACMSRSQGRGRPRHGLPEEDVRLAAMTLVVHRMRTPQVVAKCEATVAGADSACRGAEARMRAMENMLSTRLAQAEAEITSTTAALQSQVFTNVSCGIGAALAHWDSPRSRKLTPVLVDARCRQPR